MVYEKGKEDAQQICCCHTVVKSGASEYCSKMGRHSSWQAHTARDEDTMEGRMKEVVVFKDVPARLTERQAEAEQARKVAGESKALLQAFAQSYDGESDSSVARRLEHMQETWGCFESKFQVG